MYRWETGQVLKLFHDWFPPESIETEARLARAVAATGLPVPAVGGLVPVGSRLGLVYERVDGPSMLDELLVKPWAMSQSARLLAELQAEIHAKEVRAELPSLHSRLEHKLEAAPGLDSELRAKLLSRLADLAAGNRLCHGDFHPGNVLLAAAGPVVIDWMDVAQGSPAADVARSSIILRGIAASAGVPRPQRAMATWYHRLYLRHCVRLGLSEEEVRLWLPVVAAARLAEGIEEIEEFLLGLAGRGLWGR